MNNKQNRRAKATIIWAVLITASYYICLFKGMDLTWFAEFAKWMTFALGFVVGGLTVTDAVLKK